jgi:hypothetical protein
MSVQFIPDARQSDIVAGVDVAHIGWDDSREIMCVEDRSSDCQGRLDVPRGAGTIDGWEVALHARLDQTGRRGRRREECRCSRP